MSDIGDAIGTAAEGGLLARAVSSRATGDGTPTPLQGGHFAEDSCLNCGTPLTGKHCHNCGQKAHLHRTMGAFLHDLLHGALHLDGKTWRTLPLLVLKPGHLMRRYIDGERARFVSPMALFLFSVFLMFAVFQVAGLSVANLDLDDAGAVFDAEETRANVAIALETAREERADIVTELEELTEQDLERGGAAELRVRLGAIDERIAALEEGQTALGMIQLGGPAEEAAAPSADEDGKKRLAGNEDGQLTLTATGVKSLDEGILKKWQDDPKLMLYKMQNNTYKFSWLLIPISVPFVWLLFFWKRRFRIYDHAIFVTYSLSFMSLLFLALSLLGMAGVPVLALLVAGALIPPLHIYKQLRYGYELRRIGAFGRTALLTLVMINFVIIIFMWLLLLLGVF